MSIIPDDLIGVADEGGGPGSDTFTGLTDTPANYVGQAFKPLRVTSAENAVEFADVETLAETPNEPASYITETGIRITGGPAINDGLTKISVFVQFRTGTNVALPQIIWESGGVGVGVAMYIGGAGIIEFAAGNTDTPYGNITGILPNTEYSVMMICCLKRR